MFVSGTAAFGLGELLESGSQVRDCAGESAELIWLLSCLLVRHCEC